MKKVTDKAESRGRSSYDWLDSRHTFSFDKYYNPRRMNFGALRVLNDDRIAPGKGFGTHPHKNMEIISIPLKGKLKHGDSKQNSRTITIGGRGIQLFGYYPDLEKLCRFGIASIHFAVVDARAGMLQQAWFSIGEVEAGKKLGYHLHQSHAGVYIFLIEGEIKVDGTVLSRRDGMGVYETDSFELETLQDSHILLIEVPM